MSTLFLAFALACAPTPVQTQPEAETAAPAPPSPTWPSPGTELHPPQFQIPADFAKKRIVVDAGHGAGINKNRGTTTVFCEKEEAFTLRVAEAIAPRLEATGAFEVRMSRQGDERTEYADRVRAAENWPADAFISIHADARRGNYDWSPEPGKSCPREDFATGFAVLWSDEGDPLLVERRREIATSIADNMAITGFGVYDGFDYVGLYDPTHPGVFVDRHVPKQRIMTLRRFKRVPSIIVETHQAWNLDEAQRWAEPSTLNAFADALAVALVGALK